MLLENLKTSGFLIVLALIMLLGIYSGNAHSQEPFPRSHNTKIVQFPIICAPLDVFKKDFVENQNIPFKVIALEHIKQDTEVVGSKIIFKAINPDNNKEIYVTTFVNFPTKKGCVLSWIETEFSVE